MSKAKLEVVGEVGEITLGDEWKIVRASDLPEKLEGVDKLNVRVGKIESAGAVVIIEFE